MRVTGKRRMGRIGALGAMVLSLVMAFLLPACGNITSRPLSVDSVSGEYALYPEAVEGVNSILSEFGKAGIPEVTLSLGSDGTGKLVMSKGGKDSETKNLSWRLDGGARNPEILLTLTDAISPDDKWVSFLMMLESDPTHTKIRGDVAEGEIRLRQSAPEGERGIEFVFTKVGEAE